MVANRGITAGSGFAASELRLLMLQIILPLMREWGDGIDLTLDVDDLIIGTSGCPRQAAKSCAELVKHVVHRLEGEFGFQVSANESIVLGSSAATAAETAKPIKNHTMKPA